MVIEILISLRLNNSEESLRLNCYSYKVIEFKSVYNVLNESRAEYSEFEIPPDREGRTGLSYQLWGHNIQKLENYLKIKFFSREEEVLGEGEEYKCERLSVLYNETGCKRIYAANDDAANVICAIVARKSGWFSGVASRGSCRRSL